MILDRIENSNYILQNTLIGHSTSQLRIPLKRQYYADYDMMEDCFNCYNDYVYYGPNNEFCELANEEIKNMKPEEWHLLPQAYSITLTLGPLLPYSSKKRRKSISGKTIFKKEAKKFKLDTV